MVFLCVAAESPAAFTSGWSPHLLRKKRPPSSRYSHKITFAVLGLAKVGVGGQLGLVVKEADAREVHLVYDGKNAQGTVRAAIIKRSQAKAEKLKRGRFADSVPKAFWSGTNQDSTPAIWLVSWN